MIGTGERKQIYDSPASSISSVLFGVGNRRLLFKKADTRISLLTARPKQSG